MVLQNLNDENKIFIDEDVKEFITIRRDEDEPRSKTIYIKEDNKIYNILFCEENMSLGDINEIFYDAKEDRLWFYSAIDYRYYTADRLIKEDEIISLSLGVQNDCYQYINLNIVKLPKFLSEDDKFEHYPKFEINLSDCIYNIKIYLSQTEFIEFPYFQSSYHIMETLEYIKNLVAFINLEDPAFIYRLCNNAKMQLSIYDKSNMHITPKCVGCEVVEYKLGEDGLYLNSTEGELENQMVPYNVFFKLVMDKTWEVDFIDDDNLKNKTEKNCSNCANSTEPDEIDNGCYMCCKGFEDNYVPKE